MAQFSPRPSQSTFNPANAFRPPRTMVNSQGETSRRIVAGQRAESAAQSQEITGSLDAITGSSDRLRGRLERMTARQSQVDEAERQRAADLTARIAANQMQNRAKLTLDNVNHHGLADGSDAKQLFEEGGVDPNGDQWGGWSSAYSEITEGMDGLERERFDSRIATMRDDFNTAVEKMATTKKWDFAKQGVVERLQLGRESVTETPTWDTFAQNMAIIPDELALVIQPGSKDYNDTLKTEKMGLTLAYVNGLLSQGEVGFDYTGAHILKELLYEDALTELNEDQKIQFNRDADAAINGWQRNKEAETQGEVSEYINMMLDGHVAEYDRSGIDLIATWNPELAERLNYRVEYTMGSGAFLRESKKAPITQASEMLAMRADEVDQSVGEDNPTRYNEARQAFQRDVETWRAQMQFRQSDPIGWMVDTNTDAASREAVLAGLIFNAPATKGDLAAIEQGPGIAIAQRDQLRSYEDSGHLRNVAPPAILSSETMNKLANQLLMSNKPDEVSAMLQRMQVVLGPEFPATIAAMSEARPQVGAYSIASDFGATEIGRSVVAGDKNYAQLDTDAKNEDDWYEALDSAINSDLDDLMGNLSLSGKGSMRHAVKAATLHIADQRNISLEDASKMVNAEFNRKYQAIGDTTYIDVDRYPGVNISELNNGVDFVNEDEVVKIHILSAIFGHDAVIAGGEGMLDQNITPLASADGGGFYFVLEDGTVATDAKGNLVTMPPDALELYQYQYTPGFGEEIDPDTAAAERQSAKDMIERRKQEIRREFRIRYHGGSN